MAADPDGEWWRCECGRMTIRLPFKPILLAPCCLKPYHLVRRAVSYER